MKTWTVLIGLLLIPVVAFAAHILQTTGSSARERATTARESSPTEDETSNSGQWDQRAEPPSPEAPQPRLQATQAPPAPSLEEEGRAQPTARPHKTEADREAELETAFQSARPGGAFEKGLDRKLRTLFETRQIDSLECREAHCRMELSFPDAASADKRLSDVFMAPDFDLGVSGTIASRTVGRNGSMAVRVYLYRESDTDSAPQPGNE